MSVFRGCAFLLLWLVPAAAWADILFYNVPLSDKKKLQFVLQGTAIRNPGRSTTFQHHKFGKIYFDSREVEIRYVPSQVEVFNKMSGRAGKDADKQMEAANWALRHGLLPQFYLAVDKSLAADPNHPRATLVRELKAKMDEPIGDSSQQEKEMRKLIKRDEMKIKQSKHFILLHDTPDKPAPPRKLPRAEERLQLLEAVYESFLLRFYAHGVELDLPRERMKVVLFSEHQDYLRFATTLGPDMASTGGFWSGTTNTSVFFDQGTTPSFKTLVKLSDMLQADKAEAQRRKKSGIADQVRFADTISLIVEIERENEDIKVVSHEATHQLAGNTGLLPQHVLIPSWAHEGLAAYFETSDGASWGGVGAVNSERLDYYKALARDREHSNIDFIVGDQIFDFAKSTGAKLHGYGQAWALTHFLMERHFPEFINFYRRLGEMPPHVNLSAEILTELFHDCIKHDNSSLDAQWRTYMNSLETDLDKILGER